MNTISLTCEVSFTGGGSGESSLAKNSLSPSGGLKVVAGVCVYVNRIGVWLTRLNLAAD